MRGGRYMTPALAEKIAFSLASPSTLDKPHHALSEREMEILQLIGAGKSLKEIAAIQLERLRGTTRAQEFLYGNGIAPDT